MTGRAPVHRVRPNHREWSPPQVMFFDTETDRQMTDAGELHTLRLWAARLDVRRTRNGKGCGTATGFGYTAADLADQIEIFAAGQKCLWIYAHNLAFDLAVTRLPAVLHDRGWTVTGHAVSSDSPWLRMKRDGCVLTFSDSWGWLRAPLDRIGADVGYVKPDLPGWQESDAAWLARCHGDVEILARAMLQLMDWWDAEQLGSWTLTGSAGGWNTWRHRTTAPLPLIKTDPDQVTADRAAIYGGRREAFTHGNAGGGPFTLLDFASAYPTVAANFPLPAARQGNFDSLPADSPLVLSDQFGIIAEVEIETGVPRWPVRVNGRIAYPAGRFRTVLAGPEIAEARRLGCLRAIGPGWLHALSPHMAEWASWVLQVTAPGSDCVPAVARRAVKHWGRAVIGKTAARGWRTMPLASLGGTGWDYRPAWNAELSAPSHLTDVCGQVAETVQHGDGDNAYPAILAWVESWTRVMLTRVIDAIGQADVITCDTDGLIVRTDVAWKDAVARAGTGPMLLREKGRYNTVTVLGPQHVIAPGDRKLSGVPRAASDDGTGKLTALLWPGLATQMALRPGGTEPGFLRPYQSYTLAESYVTGWVMSDGTVRPLTAAVCDAGATHLLPDGRARPDLYPPQLQASHVQKMTVPMPDEGSPCLCHMFRSNGITGGSSPSALTTSSASHRNLTVRVAGKRRSWLTTGGRHVSRALRACYGRIRT